MKVIGITGGVGSGKSAVLDGLSNRLNCVILYADDVAKTIEKKGNKCYDDLLMILGDEVLDENEEIDKKKMALMIFNDEDLLLKTNNVIHPAVREYIIDSIEKEKNKGKADIFFIEAALLIECGYLSVVDEMWYIYADMEVRRQRLKTSRGYSDEKIDSIMKSQLPDEEYRKNSHFVIDNSKDLQESIDQVMAHIRSMT